MFCACFFTWLISNHAPKKRGIHNVLCACFFTWLILNLGFKNEVYTMCCRLVSLCGVFQISALKTRHTQCVVRLFLFVAYFKSWL